MQALLAPAKPLQGLSAADGPAPLTAAMAGAVALLHTHRHAHTTNSLPDNTQSADNPPIPLRCGLLEGGPHPSFLAAGGPRYSSPVVVLPGVSSQSAPPPRCGTLRSRSRWRLMRSTAQARNSHNPWRPSQWDGFRTSQRVICGDDTVLDVRLGSGWFCVCDKLLLWCTCV